MPRRLFPLLLAASISLLAAGLGCAANDCRRVPLACTGTADCCDGLTCLKGSCTAAPVVRCADGTSGIARGDACNDSPQCCDGRACREGTCQTPPATCPAQSPISCGAVLPGKCCFNSNPVCCARDGKCHQSTASCMAPTCAGADKACVASTSCCAGLTCSRFGKTCQPAAALKLGEPCAKNGDCLSGRCEGFCTRICRSNAECTEVTYCIQTSAGNLCVPWCGTGSNTLCSVYDGATCQAAEDIDGTSRAVCLGQ